MKSDYAYIVTDPIKLSNPQIIRRCIKGGGADVQIKEADKRVIVAVGLVGINRDLSVRRNPPFGEQTHSNDAFMYLNRRLSVCQIIQRSRFWYFVWVVTSGPNLESAKGGTMGIFSGKKSEVGGGGTRTTRKISGNRTEDTTFNRYGNVVAKDTHTPDGKSHSHEVSHGFLGPHRGKEK